MRNDINLYFTIASTIATVLALVFTLYLWLLDHLNADEAKFIEHKMDYVADLEKSLNLLKSSSVTNTSETVSILSEDISNLSGIISEANNLVGIIVNYRFWVKTLKKSEHEEMIRFYEESKYIISELERFSEYLSDHNNNPHYKEKDENGADRNVDKHTDNNINNCTKGDPANDSGNATMSVMQISGIKSTYLDEIKLNYEKKLGDLIVFLKNS